MQKKQVVVMVSGGFDPIHVGHVRMFKKAKALGDKLVVVINNDNWLEAKKGYAFMPDDERKELIESIKYVDEVVLTKHAKGTKDMSVSHMLKAIRPDIFANGGDRNEKDAANPASSLYADIQTCKKHGIKMAYNMGEGGKVQSSSWLLKNFAEVDARRPKPVPVKVKNKR
jgi:D-beta-D-heptose 7-phosphate kinase/D-beta-D-heptose 1-phosphate adenosyltransferase